jgi:Cyclic nucleotide-binding domain/Major Facilitator Superfamily
MLGNRALVRIEVAWAAASLGNWAFSILLALYAYAEGGTDAVAIALVVRMLPAGLAAPYAAMLADRHARRSVLLWSAALRTVALLGTAAAAAAGAPLGAVLALAAAFTIANTAHRPAQAALTPQLSRTPAELAAANVCWSTLDNVGFLLGSVAAGVLASVVALEVGFAACAVALAATWLITTGLPGDDRPAPLDEEEPGAVAEVLAGVRTVAAHPEIRLQVLLFAVVALANGIFDVLIVIAAIELLDLGASGAGWLNAAWGVGGVAGGAASLALLSRGRLASGLSIGLALAGLASVLLGWWAQAAPAFPLMVAIGLGIAVVETALLTLNQRLAADDVLARVFGVEETLDVVMMALGSIVAAALIGALGTQGAIIATGAVLPVVALAVAPRLAGTVAGARVPERAFALIRSLPVFAQLPTATLETLALRLRERRYAPGERIVVQGELGDTFFVIADGTVAVDVDGAPRPPLAAGDFFGEIALLHDVPRTASITAAEPVQALLIDRAEFLDGIGAHARSTRAAEAVASDRIAADARIV